MILILHRKKKKLFLLALFLSFKDFNFRRRFGTWEQTMWCAHFPTTLEEFMLFVSLKMVKNYSLVALKRWEPRFLSFFNIAFFYYSDFLVTATFVHPAFFARPFYLYIYFLHVKHTSYKLLSNLSFLIGS